MKQIIFSILFFFILSLPVSILAVEVAPRISDREIIEKLAILEAGQTALGQKVVDLREEMKAGQAALGKKIDDMNQRISSQQTTMLALFSSIVALILALFAYIAWDRRTMMKPLMDQVNRLETDLTHELELQHGDGSLLSRQLKALRKYARKNPEFAEIMRSVSLL